MSPTSIAAYVVLFGSVGLLFLLVSLLLGRLLRPDVPTPAKLDAYECGEPAVGSSFVQFDLRFYVVALVFIVFEVEVALFFPPATIFGTATRWMKPQAPPDASGSLEAELGVTVKGMHQKEPTSSPVLRNRRCDGCGANRRGRPHVGPCRGRRPGRVFRFDLARLRLRLAAGRSRLGAGHRHFPIAVTARKLQVVPLDANSRISTND